MSKVQISAESFKRMIEAMTQIFQENEHAYLRKLFKDTENLQYNNPRSKFYIRPEKMDHALEAILLMTFSEEQPPSDPSPNEV